MIDSERPSYDELEARFGPPLGVEEARARWGTLISAARSGTTTLITRERWEWAALVPMSAVPGMLSGLPVLSLSTARAKLGDIVRQAAQPYDEGPLLLTRHRTPVAALVAARRLLDRPAPQRRPPLEELLTEGRTITLARGPQDDIAAIARDRDGTVMAAGSGGDIAEALRSLRDQRD
ncbi:prevent-host-death family protein [Nonomuraea solani]|uniref:Prevent-host-death family protein n=1 Tax=Nonomuraea solani TaxID=1144553 RepID=A0A1H6EK79_9ACTN|nr:type II toxin-antitoxin system prevent-host-death family antitoxin [Nonomuraea solani]SEG97154.1 prevent-host-death family protein [Nonomuraea solani]